MHVLAPVVAGSFYPADPVRLTEMVDRLLDQAPELGAPSPKALIIPHAGYRFSGQTAAVAVRTLAPGPRRVVILGPSHRHAFPGVALPACDAMQTPLGQVPLDGERIAALRQQPDVSIVPEAFAAEHSIEVELPLLQRRLGDFQLTPLIIGDIATKRLAQILESLWGAEETLIVVSTDLTHFLTGQRAEEIDARTASAIEMAKPAGIGPQEACGHRPLGAFLAAARDRGLRITRVGLTHSGHVTGQHDRVVGYGGWVAHPPTRARLSNGHRNQALRLARQALLSRAERGKSPKIHLPSFPVPLQGFAAAFVTLNRQGRLRGCIGSLRAHRPLAADILDNAVKAGFGDPRFKPVTREEIAGCEIEIAILSRPAPMVFQDEDDLIDQLHPGRDGLILQSGDKRGTFLPKVWDSLASPDAFLAGLKVKAGLSRDHWSPDIRISRYMAETFTESSAD